MRTIHTKMVNGLALILALFFTAGVGFAGTGMEVSGSTATERPIEDYLERQGALCLTADFSAGFYLADRTDDCPAGSLGLFIPPVKNKPGWSDPARDLGAVVDSAGLANDVIGPLGTEFVGEIKERELADGRALVTVKLETENALIYAVQGGDFGGGPVVFGERWDSMGNIDEPALGDSKLVLVFVNTAPGAPMPDLLHLFFLPDLFPGEELELISVVFRAEAESDGLKFKMHQVCGAPCGPDLVFMTEDIIIRED